MLSELEGKFKMIKGFYKTLLDLTTKHDFVYGLYFSKDWAALLKRLLVTSGGINVGQIYFLL